MLTAYKLIIIDLINIVNKLLLTYAPTIYAALQYCEAYFERETGYDISILTNNKKQTVYLITNLLI